MKKYDFVLIDYDEKHLFEPYLQDVKFLFYKKKFFSDGECFFELLQYQILEYKNILIVFRFQNNNFNKQLFELFLFVSFIKNFNPFLIDLFIPYLPYLRQDKMFSKNKNLVPFGKILLNILERIGINKIFSCDIHSQLSIDFSDGKLINIETTEYCLKKIKNNFAKNQNDFFIVSPDFGAQKRTQQISNNLKINNLFFKKTRSKDGKILVETQIGINNFQNKSAIVIDDIIDSANTFLSIYAFLEKNNISNISCFFTHAVFSGEAINKLKTKDFLNFFITDSIFYSKKNLPDFIEVIEIYRDVLFKKILK